MRKTTVYRDAYKDFTIEVNYNGETDAHWTAYFIIPKDKVTQKVWESVLLSPVTSKFWKEPHFDYMDAFGDLELQGGITYYNQLYFAEKAEIWAVKLGCDYNHIWNQGRTYTLENVTADIKVAVDSFLSRQEI